MKSAERPGRPPGSPPAGWAGGRRRLVLRGMGLGVAGMLPAGFCESPAGNTDLRKIGSNGGAAVPSTVVSLADHGGKPGASPAMLAASFTKAFDALAAAGGGTLYVPSGVYDFGVLAGDAAILRRNARDIAISAYGATFMASTRTTTAPNLFYFFNFSNVTIAGASFYDAGFIPWINWRGMHCVGLQADAPSREFRMIDCYAQHVVGMLASHNNASTRRYIAGVTVHGEVRDTYYGAGVNFIRQGVDIDLACHNVRRALIGYALNDARIAVRIACTPDWPGSNGAVALVCSGASEGNVDKVRVSVDVTGAGIHSSYVHFYHQGPERFGRMHDIEATVNLVDVRDAGNLFTFDHEADGVLGRTARSWDRIALHGKVDGQFSGKVVANPSISESPGTVYLDQGLAALAGTGSLPANFQVRPP